MSEILGTANRGGGDTAIPDPQKCDGVNDARLAELQELSAKEAIESLEGEFASGKLDLVAPVFPGPIAEAFYWDDGTIVGIQGPVGSGKTTTKYQSRLRRARCAPRSVKDGRRRYKLLVIRATYRQLWSTTIPDFLFVFPKNLGDWSGGKGGPVTFTMFFEDDSVVPPPPGHVGDWHNDIEMIVEFMAFGDDIQGAMRGYQATDIDLHEMDTNPIDVMLNGITRINRYPGKDHFEGYPLEMRDYGQIVGDFNAPEPDSWVVDLFHNEDKREDVLRALNAELEKSGAKKITISFHRQPGYGEGGCENLFRLGPGYYKGQIATLTLLGRGDTIDRLVYNKVVHTRAGEPVFQREFNPRIHVSDVPIKPWSDVPLVLGLDQGLKGAAVVGQRLVSGTGLGRKVRWQILGELHFPDERLLARVFGTRLSEFLEDRWPGLRIEGAWADMAGEHGSSAAAEENETWNLLVGRAGNFRVRPQRIGTNRIGPRLEAVRACLEAPIEAGAPGILIDPSCKFLIAGFEARYVWAEEVNANGDKSKVPDKRLTEANVMDALQYLLLSEHRPDGTAPGSFPGASEKHRRHNGGPPLDDRGAMVGLRTDYDLLNPYNGA